MATWAARRLRRARSRRRRASGSWREARGYLIGRLIDRRGDLRGFGIWDGEEPGSPIERFRATPAGRDGALERFRELEGSSMILANQDPPACPRCGHAVDPMDATDRMVNLVTGLVVFGWLGAALANSGRRRFICPNCRTQV